MADTLGLHIAPDGITAVRLDAVAGTPATTIVLGDDGPAAATIVAQDESGAVLVGDAAQGADGPTVTDPLERAAAGRIGALATIINHVVGRATTAGGSAPTRVAVVVPDDFDGAARDRVVEAGSAAGVADTVAVPQSVAETRRGGDDDVVAAAAGAARVASLAAAPIVTREDLGESVVERPPTPPPVPPTPQASVSVFDEVEDEPAAPARPAPEPVAARPATEGPPTEVVPAAQPQAQSQPQPQPEPLRYEAPRRRISGGAIAVAVLLGLIAAVGIGIVVFTGDDETPIVTDETPTTTAPPTTTDAPTTTVGDDTATTTEPPTTTVPPATTEPPTTTEPPSTTTTPVPVASPGLVTLVETGLQLDGGAVILFGQSADSVIPAITDVLGEPDRDGGYEESAFCFGARSRFVAWGDLELVFTEEELESEDGRFTQWYASGHEDPEGLVTFSGIGVTATVGFLEVTLGSSLQLVEAIPEDPTGLFAATNPGSGALLNGTTSSRDPEGQVTALWAGDACTRIFT